MNNEYHTDDDKAVLKTAVDALDQSIEHLDGYTLSRLNQARHRALDQTARPRLFNSQWLRVGAVAAVIFTLVNGWMMFTTSYVQPMDTDDFELVVVNEDFELMQEVDFFAWMIEQEHAS
jgi:membrane-anchored glycerophosphoryl diester phosphodiesterase (GDPDase)